MSEMIAVRHVEVRSWPERSDVLVIDQDQAIALSHYRLDDIPGWAADDPVFDISAPYAARCESALRDLERDQERLILHFGLPRHATVRLACTAEPRASLERLLVDHGLNLALVELSEPGRLVDALTGMDERVLWHLVADWFDRAERRFRPGTGRQQASPWVMRSHPDRADHFHHLSDGDTGWAYESYRDTIDVPAAEVRLHHVLQWALYARTEFAEFPCPPPAALAHLLPGIGR